MTELNDQAVDAIPGAVLVLSREGSIVHANSHAAALFGCESGELAGRPATEVIPELRKDEKAEPTSPRQLQAVRRDDAELIVEVSMGPIAEGERWVVLVRDVTAAAQDREAERETAQRFRIVATHTAELFQYANVEENRYEWFGDVDGMTGYEPGGFPRTIDGWLEQIHPDDRERISAEVERLIENGGSGWSFRYRVRTKDGSYRHWFDRGSVTGFVDGRGNEGIGAIVDETDVVVAREELQRSESRFRIAAMQAADVLQYINVEDNQLTWFGDIDALMGYERGAFPRTFDAWYEQIHPDDVDRVKTEVERIVENGEPGWNVRYRIRAKDGSYHHWLDRGTITDFLDGRANEGIGAIVDETHVVVGREELEKALHRLTEQGALNEAVLNSLHGQLAVLDPTGTITAVNARWREFGIENDPGVAVAARLGVGANYLETCERAGTGEAHRAVKGIRSVLGGSSPVFTMRYPCHSPSEKRWFSMTVTPMEDEGAIVVHTDVTNEMVAHEELERALGEITRLKKRLEAEGQYLQEEIKSSHNFDDIVGSSAELLATLRKLEQVAETNATVLLHGETGTGKELLARATHARSKRSKRPLIKVDCTTLPPGLIESELFGHEKGAFTGAHQSQAGRFELAHRGTVFLDEVGELPLELQPKLLRVIQEGELERVGGRGVKKVDVRVIAATNRNLLDEVEAGRFRADLYYRLSVFPVEVPPLRDRRQDVPPLAAFFVAQKSRELGKEVNRIPPATMEALVGYDWPGNIRELQNVIERAIILSPGRDLLLAEALEPHEAQPQRASGVLRKDLEELERKQILDALRATEWKVKGEGNAASRLGLKPSTLRSRMKRLGIQRH